jgi:hypothetical protein
MKTLHFNVNSLIFFFFMLLVFETKAALGASFNSKTLTLVDDYG